MFNKVFYVTKDKELIEEFNYEVGMVLPLSNEFVCINETHYLVAHREFDYSKKVIIIILTR